MEVGATWFGHNFMMLFFFSLLVVLSHLQHAFSFAPLLVELTFVLSTVTSCTTSSFGLQSSKPTQTEHKTLYICCRKRSRPIQPTKVTAKLKEPQG
jgi:hypothetical protein